MYFANIFRQFAFTDELMLTGNFSSELGTVHHKGLGLEKAELKIHAMLVHVASNPKFQSV